MYDFDDDDFDGRNARRRRRVALGPRRPSYGYGPGYPQQGVQLGVGPAMMQPTAPWYPPTAAPAVDRFTGSLKLGVMIDAAAKALSAMSSLPPAPSVSGEGGLDHQNLVKWIDAALTHFKRGEQIRTVGSLARLFLI